MLTPGYLPHRLWPVTVAAGTVAAVAAAYVVLSLVRDDPAASCGSAVLRVSAAPEIAPVVKDAAAALGGCTRVEVTAQEPAATAREMAAGRSPDVWIPDSSRWLTDTSGVGGVGVGAGAGGSDASDQVPSIASSPVVLAVRAASAGTLGPRPTYDALADAGTPTLTLSVPDPRTSAATQAVVADLRTSLGGDAELRGRLAALLRGLHVEAPGSASQLSPDVAVQVASRQEVAAANAAAGRKEYVAVGPAEAGRSLDYPYAVSSFENTKTAAAHALLDGLTSATTRARLEQLGFRTRRAGVHPLTAEDGDGVVAALAELSRPTRILAVVDVSGSMSRLVPGTDGRTRIDLARAALSEGMRLFDDHTVAGLWRFSANLTPSTDYEQVVPLTEITSRNRSAVAEASQGLAVKPNGGTGLYATTLAAVRTVRTGYDPSRVNSVLVLSDGRDEKAAAHHIDLDKLVATLQEEADPDRPVIVNMIAYGPDSDAGAMQRIATATGGTVYAVRDPRELAGVFRDAIGNRLCADAC